MPFPTIPAAGCVSSDNRGFCLMHGILHFVTAAGFPIRVILMLLQFRYPGRPLTNDSTFLRSLELLDIYLPLFNVHAIAIAN
jgi:hypothetical protein